MKKFKLLGSILVFFPLMAISSCIKMKYSPWETKPSHQNLTQLNLDRLEAHKATKGFIAKKFRIGILGDPQGYPGDFRKVIDRLNQIDDLAFILVLGDLTDYGLLHEYEWAYDALKQSRVPYFTAIGNHDAISHGKEIYQKMFGSFDYTFTYAGVKFVIWNNNKSEFQDANLEWLAQQVTDQSVVASHMPPVIDAHTASEIDRWVSINEKAGIMGSLHGHRGSNQAFREKIKGIPYYIVAKAKGRHYALVSFEDSKITSIEDCVDVCGSEVSH